MCDVYFCSVLGTFIQIKRLSELYGVRIKRSRLYLNSPLCRFHLLAKASINISALSAGYILLILQ